MNFKDMLDKLSVLSEATKETEKGRVHKADPGGYGRKYDTDEEGDEKDGDKDAAKPQEKRGRGRPAKTGAHVSSPQEKKKQKDKEEASKALQSFIVGNVPKKSKDLEKLPKKKHSLKEFFEQIDEERMLKEAEQITIMPARSNTQVIQKGNQTLGTVRNPQLAAQIKQAIGRGEMSLAGSELGEEKVNEKWAGDAKIKSTGEYSKKSVEELKSMLAKLKKSGPHDADSPEAKKQRQINFALRSKGGWKKGEGAAMKEGVAEGSNSRPFDQMANLKSKSNKELDELVRFWQSSLRKNPNHKVANDQLQIIKMIRAERIGKKGVAEVRGNIDDEAGYYVVDEDGNAVSGPFVSKQEAYERAAAMGRMYDVKKIEGVAKGDIDEGVVDNLKKAAAAGILGLGLAAGGTQMAKDHNKVQDVRQTLQQAPTVKIGSKDYKVYSQDLASKDELFNRKVNRALKDKIIVTDGSGNQFYLGVSSNNGHRFGLLPTSQTKVNSPTATVGTKQMTVISPTDYEKGFGRKAVFDKILVKDNSGNSYYLQVTSNTGHDMWLVPVKEGKINEVEQPTMDNMSAMGAGLGAGRSNKSLEEAKKTVKRDDKAEKAGKKVAKDIEYDEKVKDKIHGKKRHAEDEKAEKAGKKVAKDIEYDEKKDKKKKVNESAHKHSAARLMGKAHALAKEGYNCRYDDMEEARMYHEGYKEGLDECYGLMPIRGVVVGEEVPATVPGMANQAERMAMEADLDEMDKTEYMRHKARTTPGDTFKAFGQTMRDKDVLESPFAFESLDKQLNDLLVEGEVVEEGMSVSISKGNQGAPDSVTVSAQDHEAEKLLSFIKQAGLGLFGDEAKSDYGSPAGEISKHAHGDIEVVDDHDGMMSLMKKMAGMDHGSDDGDYRDEEHHGDHDHEEETCNECGYMESKCECDEEMVEDESYDQEEEIAAESDELAELKRLVGHNTAQPQVDSKLGMQEDNPPDSEQAEHTADEDAEAAEDAALAKSDAAQNAATKQVNIGEDGMEASEEPVQPMTDVDEEKDNLKEWANNAGQRGTETTFVTDEEFMIDTITSGLNKRKATGQTTIPVIASQGARDGTEDISAWRKLAGLTK